MSQLPAHAAQTALTGGARIPAAAAILRIAREGRTAHASPHAHFRSWRATTEAAGAGFGEGAVIATATAVLRVVDECNGIQAPSLAPFLTYRTASGPNSGSVAGRGTWGILWSNTGRQ